MHLIIIIAIGVFCGLWLFTKWAERRELKRLQAYEQLKAHLLSTAPYQPPAAKPAQSASIFDGPMMFALCFCWGFVLIIVFALMHG
jgi:amino acid permease